MKFAVVLFKVKTVHIASIRSAKHNQYLSMKGIRVSGPYLGFPMIPDPKILSSIRVLMQ